MNEVELLFIFLFFEVIFLLVCLVMAFTHFSTGFIVSHFKKFMSKIGILHVMCGKYLS